MRRFRYTLARLAWLIVLIGVALAAIREASPLWDAALFSVACIVLLGAILLAIHRRHASRAFWLGFALSGAVYLGLSLVPQVSGRLLTTHLLAFLDTLLPRQNSASFVLVGEPWDSKNSTGLTFTATTGTIAQSTTPTATAGSSGYVVTTTTRTWNGTSASFMGIGHSIFALLCATCGGLASRRIHARVRAGQLGSRPGVCGA
jgi:hypothetical protein